MHNQRTSRLLLGLSALALLCSCGQTASVPASTAAPPPIAADDAARRFLPAGSGTDPYIASIDLPHNEGAFPGGPGADVFLVSCTICHSPRYCSMQPPLSRAVWTAEVKKMVAVFGAPVAPGQADQLVDYLVGLQVRSAPSGNR